MKNGILYALFAAIANATIGVISLKLMNKGLSYAAISFYKCLFAFIIITLILCAKKELRNWLTFIRLKYLQLAVCALFGFFFLYFFETKAYSRLDVAMTVFIILGTATTTTYLIAYFIQKQSLTIRQLLGLLISVIGLLLVFNINSLDFNLSGIISAILAGIGYSLFLILMRKFELGSNLIVINSLIMFGTIYLFIPFMLVSVQLPSADDFSYLILLAIIPTIIGFWCTTKALVYLEAYKVQIVELSEPIIALLFAYIAFGQILTHLQMLGASLIIISIMLVINKKG